MLDKPPFFRQETDYSCVPACLRMILAYHEIETTEEELIRACRCTQSGTRASDLIEAAKIFGFTRTFQSSLAWDELRSRVSEALYPVVSITVNSTPLSFFPPPP